MLVTPFHSLITHRDFIGATGRYSMLGLAFVGILLSSVSSQDLIGVNYSFDVDFESIFNNKWCDKYDSWNLVEYADLITVSTPHNSQKGIRSAKASCTTSFPIVFFDNSVLEFDIFFDVIAEDSRLKISIFDENRSSEVTYSYGKSNSDFKPGWSTLSIAIHTNITGYINLMGYSHNNEIVIVDSFQYITNPALKRINDESSKTDNIYEPDVLLENIHEPLDLLFDNEGSGDIEGSGEEYDSHLGEYLEEEEDLDEKGVTKIED